MKNKEMDDYIRNIIRKHLDAIVIGTLLLFSLVDRYHLMKHGSSYDFVHDIIPWIENYRNSVQGAFQAGFADYYIPYTLLLATASKFNVPINYSVGSISCIFDYLTAFFIYRILSENFSEIISKRCASAIGVIYLFVPTVLLNGATWKQCDAIYSFFIVVCLKCLLDEKIRLAFIMFGIAFSFKQQSILFAPLLVILYFCNKKMKIVYGIYVVLAYLVAGLPAIFLGRPIREVYSIYLAQADEYHQMTLNYPNLYMIAMTDYETCHIYAKLFTVFALALAFWYICSKKKALSNKSIVVLAVWCVWTCCMFLPAMHQRYDYLVAVLLIISIPILLYEKPLLAISSALLFYVGNVITYSYSLFGDDYNPIFAMCCNMSAYALFCYVVFNRLSREESNGNDVTCEN